ncbi:hypothetical protein A3A92_01075 [Candidatus Nomurabacteria bacterium RIFCSPLOWO2_01_FULL_37_49]|nr:MAG: hypothetical protein A3A92_01075 [Candidatus Nomurabacteria bacterium RIFCSPLOWO2_01_FULL_37_49]
MNPGGNLKRCFSKTEYPRRLNKFLLTASLATLFGAIKEICGVVESLFNLNLKVKKEELTDLPYLNIFSTSFLLVLFFFGSMLNGQFFSALLTPS